MPRNNHDIGGYTSRKTRLEREKAIEGARNPGASKFGSSLAEINSRKDKILLRELRKIESEVKCMRLKLNQQKKTFVKSCHVLNYDPIILVERPPSPEVIRKAVAMTYDFDDSDNENGDKTPSYMKQLRSKQKTPSTVTTIDAFTVKSKKKKNIWEDAMDQKEAPVFYSTVRPSAKLTKKEQSDLHLGWSYHKPRLTPDNEIEREGLEEHRRSKTPPRSRTHLSSSKSIKSISSSPSKEVDIDIAQESDSEDEFITPFITQMAQVRSQSTHVPKETKKVKVLKRQKTTVTASMKSVHFSPSTNTSPVSRRPKLTATKTSYR